MQKLSDLKPKTNPRIIDLVQQAGVNVSEWATGKRGVVGASTNPKFCYDWAFHEPGKLVVLNLWFRGFREKNGLIFNELNMRRHADQVIREGGDSNWARRARKMDEFMELAANERLPVRVIVCEGKIRGLADPQRKSSTVSKRFLDPAPWAIVKYDPRTGDCLLERGAEPRRFVDQFVLQSENKASPEKTDKLSSIFKRDSRVRDAALLRAGGYCEWCHKLGFEMKNGDIYLETHHIIPLSEGGADTVSNVTALCPNHHREAHHGKTAKEMRGKLLLRFERKVS